MTYYPLLTILTVINLRAISSGRANKVNNMWLIKVNDIWLIKLIIFHLLFPLSTVQSYMKEGID